MARRLRAVCAALALAGPASARGEPPAPAAPAAESATSPSAQVPEDSPTEPGAAALDVVLPCGLRVLAARDLSLPVAAVVLAVEVGSEDDPPEYPGLVHALAYHLYQGNRELRPGEAIAAAQDAGGIHLLATGPGQVRFESLVPISHLPDVLFAESQRLRFPTIDRTRWEISLGWAAADTKPQSRLRPEQLAALHGAPGLAHDGRAVSRSLSGMVLGSIAAQLANKFSYSRSTLIVVGPDDPAEILKQVTARFADLPASSRQVPARPPPPPRPALPQTASPTPPADPGKPTAAPGNPTATPGKSASASSPAAAHPSFPLAAPGTPNRAPSPAAASFLLAAPGDPDRAPSPAAASFLLAAPGDPDRAPSPAAASPSFLLAAPGNPDRAPSPAAAPPSFLLATLATPPADPGKPPDPGAAPPPVPAADSGTPAPRRLVQALAWPVPATTAAAGWAGAICRALNRQKREASEPRTARLICDYEPDPRRGALLLRPVGVDDPIGFIDARLARLAGADAPLLTAQAAVVAQAIRLRVRTPLGMARQLAAAAPLPIDPAPGPTPEARPLDVMTGLASLEGRPALTLAVDDALVIATEARP